VGVSVERGKRAGYKCVNCWSVSMASSESAVWMELEPVGWSMRVLGPHSVCGVFSSCVMYVVFPCIHLRSYEGSGGGLCAVLRMKNVYSSYTVDVVQ
jgi:hypothetical protein